MPTRGWRAQNSGCARSRLWRPSGGVPTQSSSSRSTPASVPRDRYGGPRQGASEALRLKSDARSVEATTVAAVDSVPDMQHRHERVLLETARYRIKGALTLPRDGYRSRVSDFLNFAESGFISLTEVTIQALDANGQPGEEVHRDFIAVARAHVVLATTVDDPRAIFDSPEDDV